jgi:hypothetical protein
LDPQPPRAVMHTSRVSSRVFFCLETASLYLSPTRLHSPTPPTHFPLCHRFLRHSTPLASTLEGAALPDDPRLASCSTRALVCITVRVLALQYGEQQVVHPNPKALSTAYHGKRYTSQRPWKDGIPSCVAILCRQGPTIQSQFNTQSESI